jgi:hypothetical protein
MNYLDTFNPVTYLYLNPELQLNSNILTVEQANNYYKVNSNNSNLYSNINLPSDFNYNIYLEYNRNSISNDLPYLYSNLIFNSNMNSNFNPERLSIIHYTRYNTLENLKYAVQSDFSIEVYKTFNDVTLDYLMPSEYYVQYLQRSNLGQLGSLNKLSGTSNQLVLGTVSDFMQNILTSAFQGGFAIHSDLNVDGKITSCNLEVKNTGIIQNIIASNISVDTLTVTNQTFTQTLFQDGVLLENQLIVTGSNSIFSCNVQIQDLTVINESTFSNNVYILSNLNVLKNTTLSNLYVNSSTQLYGTTLLSSNLIVNKISDFYDTATFYNGINIIGSNSSFVNTVNFNNLNVDNIFRCTNTASFSNTVTINSNLYANNNVEIKGTLQVVDKVSLSNDVKFLKTVQVTDNVSFSNNLNVSNIITATEYITVSDNRIKQNIIDYNKEKAQNIIKNIKVKEYNILNNENTSIGLIAQDLEKITKNLVKITDTHNILINKNINYDINNKKYISDSIFYNGDIIKYSYVCSQTNQCILNIKTGIICEYSNKCFKIINKLNNIEESNKNIFIHERIINDFKSVNYMEIIMLCVSCIQDIYSKIE